MAVREGGHTDRGKWSQPGVPHRGWTCVGTEDLGSPSLECEMCESAPIRYVHRMSHAHYPIELGVGCVCAENMEGDYVAPGLREKVLRLKARRQATWPRRKWRDGFSGYSYLNTEGFCLTVAPEWEADRARWSVSVTHRATGATQAGTRRYATQAEAKVAGLDALLWAKERLVP